MAEGIVYLDVDDEITSAASRIRTAPGTKVVLVVPYGSRIATSRMNFRLLSREAVVSNHRLSIVSGDAAARSLAASAGLPVFGTVGEYESSLATGGETADPSAGAAGAAAAGAVAVAAGPATSLLDSETVAVVGPPADPAPDADATAVVPVPAAVPTRKSQRPHRPVPDASAVAPGPVSPTGAEDDAQAGGLPPTVSLRLRAPVVAALGLVALAVIVVGVGTYLFLPAATIAVTPRRDTIGPIQLTVLADPEVAAPDPVGLVVPAVRLEVPVEAAKTFPTTGTHVEEANARGAVTFTNYDTSSGVSIPRGSIVSTEGGIRFRTQADVALQPASIFPVFAPTSDSVNVVAVKAGEGGNVPANTIRVVPEGQDPVLLRVNNPQQTSGGTHTETPEVTKDEVDKAVAELTAQLRTTFDEAVAAGAGAPPGTTPFPATADLGAITPDVDPASLVGQPVESYDLRLTAKGTVIAVDPTPVRAIAETQLKSHVTAGHELVNGSTKIEVGDGLVGEDGEVSFLASASATEVTLVDADTVRGLVKGKTADDARAALAKYGDVTVTIWPDWASTVTSVDARLTVTINGGPAGGGGAGASPSPGASRGPTIGSSRAPSARPSAAAPSASAP